MDGGTQIDSRGAEAECYPLVEQVLTQFGHATTDGCKVTLSIICRA